MDRANEHRKAVAGHASLRACRRVSALPLSMPGFVPCGVEQAELVDDVEAVLSVCDRVSVYVSVSGCLSQYMCRTCTSVWASLYMHLCEKTVHS